MTTIPLPRWLPVAAATAIVVWAVTIWWMVATLPASGSAPPDPAIGDVATEVQRLHDDLAALAEQVAALQSERDALVARLEQRPAPAAEPAPEATDVDEASPEVSAFFTDGADRYNCRDFATFADAQEALRVNGPGDPNRIDMKGNGLSCEDFRYPDRPGVTSIATPTPAATGP